MYMYVNVCERNETIIFMLFYYFALLLSTLLPGWRKSSLKHEIKLKPEKMEIVKIMAGR